MLVIMVRIWMVRFFINVGLILYLKNVLVDVKMLSVELIVFLDRYYGFVCFILVFIIDDVFWECCWIYLFGLGIMFRGYMFECVFNCNFCGG